MLVRRAPGPSLHGGYRGLQTEGTLAQGPFILIQRQPPGPRYGVSALHSGVDTVRTSAKRGSHFVPSAAGELSLR